MSQISFLDIKLDREIRRKVERMLSSYRSLDALIESLEMELPETTMTVNYQASESQRGNQFHSETEKIAMARIKVDEHKKTKAKLQRIYESLRPVQQLIWDKRYSDSKYDDLIYQELKISQRNYYRLKSELIAIVAESFCLIDGSI